MSLSRRDIAIVRGYARKTGRGFWTSEFQVRPTPLTTADPRVLDYAAMTLARRDDRSVVRIRLRNFKLERTAANGSLFLKTAGEDRVGFLGSILDLFAGLSLFPQEMEIETFGNVAHDAFELRGTGGRAPSPAVEAALEALLVGLCPLPAAGVP